MTADSLTDRRIKTAQYIEDEFREGRIVFGVKRGPGPIEAIVTYSDETTESFSCLFGASILMGTDVPQ